MSISGSGARGPQRYLSFKYCNVLVMGSIDTAGTVIDKYR